MGLFFKKFVLYAIGLSMVLNPLFSLVPEKVKAAGTAGSTMNNIPLLGIRNQKNYSYQIQSNGEQCPAVQKTFSNAYSSLLSMLIQHSGGANTLTFDDILVKSTDPKIILPTKDKEAVKSLLCLTKVMPDYAEDYEALYNDLPQSEQNNIVRAIASEKNAESPRFTTNEEYFIFLRYGYPDQSPEERVANYDYVTNLVKTAERNFSEARLKQIWQEQSNRIARGIDTSIDASTLSCVTGLDRNDLRAKIGTREGGEYIQEKINFALESLVIDIRVINVLIYLVTPKDQGGAGHWRIRVARILQGSEKSKESDATIQANLNQSATLTAANAGNTSAAVECDENTSAAECGRQQNESQVVVEDRDGTQYEAFFENMDAEYDDARNISAHYSGQAVDIKEVDDIRCTLVKKKRLGSDKKSKQPTRPIKLVWQTEEGWNQSNGASNFDMMSMMRDLAKESIVDLLSSMNEDITEYDGDLSRATFDDLVGILGQSLLGQIIDSPGHNLEGYDVSSTLKTLGGMYFADYLEMPREIFAGEDITDLEQVKYIIGRAAIEKRLGLPYGSLDNLNIIETNKNALKKPVYDLEGLILNIGQRKIEYEMGFKAHDLDRYFQLNAGQNQYLLDNRSIGRIVIENDLNLPKGSWPTTAVDRNGLANSISEERIKVLEIDPGYIDSILHVDPGTTQSFLGSTINSEQFAEKIGQSRYKDTTAGLKYFAMNNPAYQLPGPTPENPDVPDTWQEAIKGNPDYIKVIGIYTLGRLLGEESMDIYLRDDSGASSVPFLPEGSTVKKVTLSAKNGEESIVYDRAEYGRFVFREWLRRNLDERITAQDGCSAPRKNSQVEVSATYAGQSVYNGPVNLSHPTKEDIDNSVGTICSLKQEIKIDSIEYTDKDGNNLVANNLVTSEYISEDTAAAVGLEKFDLYSVMGFRQANGRAVFERIGSKLLYYAIANKILNREDRLKIDLMDSNPSLNVSENSNDTIAFYLPRMLKTLELVRTVKSEWEVIERESGEDSADIHQRIDSILSHIESMYSDADPDLVKIRKIAESVSEIKQDLAQIKGELELLKAKYDSQSGAEALNKKNQINALILDVNELIRNVSEILAGKVIPSADLLTIKQIGQSNGGSSQSNGNGGRDEQSLSSIQIALLVFDLISGKISPTDFAIRLGANTAEGKLGLPFNSLIYLVQNYDKLGITGVNAFYQAIGQARIEEEFGMPAFYFQGYDFNTKMPLFDKMNEDKRFDDLVKWAVDDDGNSTIEPLYDRYVSLLQRAGITDVSTLHQFIFTTKVLDGQKFNSWTAIAKKRWLAKNKVEASDIAIFEQTLDDVATNVSQRGYGSGIRSAQDDVLLRMGLPMGKYSSLKENSPLAWQLAGNRATKIDDNFNLPGGYTKMLFTGSMDISSNTVSNKDKNILEASALKIPKNEIDKYIQMLNGELLPGESNEYLTGLEPDYVNNNPYADPGVTGPTCPITYTEQGGFMANETTLPSDSFCYYDNAGRHCFQSFEEAQAYSNSHPESRITNILEDLAQRITTGYNQSLYDSAGQLHGARLDYASVLNGLTDFVKNKDVATIFNDESGATIAANHSYTASDNSNTTKVAISKLAFDSIEKAFKVPASVLMGLFTREYIGAPLTAYKQKVGAIEAQKILTYRLFNELGLDIDPALFDGEDLYDIFTGDYSSLYRLGAAYIDNALNLKPGTTMLIYTARSSSARQCALDQAGGTILGGVFGLDYFPINRLSTNVDNFMSALGQEQIEEALNLPRGTFRVDNGTDKNTLQNLIKNTGIVNFVSSFQIPLNLTDASVRQRFATSVNNILGDEKYRSIKNTSAQYQLKKVKEFLATSLVITSRSNEGIKQLEEVLNEMLFGTLGIIGLLSSTTPGTSLTLQKPSGVSSDVARAYADYNLQVQNFYRFITYLDNLLNLDSYSTYYLLSGATKPADYINKVGDKLGVRIGAMKLAEMLGLDQSEAQAAVDLATNLHNIFSCRSYMSTGSNGNQVCGSLSNPDEYYHNWSMLYDNLDKIFNFQLDERANLPNGTIGNIIANPENAFSILLGIGAERLDQRLFPNDPERSSKVASFSGLYRALFPEQIEPMQNECHATAFPGGEDVTLDNQMALANKQLRDIEGELRSMNLPAGDPYAADYGQSLTGDQSVKWEDWNRRRVEKLNEVNGLQATYNDHFTAERSCLLAAQTANASDPAANPDINKIPSGQLQDYLGQAWEWAQAAIVETIHNYLLEVYVYVPGCESSYPGACRENIGINMPEDDLRAMLGMDSSHPGMDLRYLTAATMAMSANLAFIELDNITTNNCNPREKSSDGCRAPIPVEMRLSYEEIKVALFGLPDDQLQELAVWGEVSVRSSANFQPDPDQHSFAPQSCEVGEVFDGIMCVAAADYVKNPVSNVQGELSYQTGYNAENLARARAEIVQQIEQNNIMASEQCTAGGLSQQNDPEGFDGCVRGFSTELNAHNNYLLDLMDHPENYDLAGTPAAKSVQKSAKNIAREKMQFDLMDAAFWKLDDNIFSGFSRIMFKGNSGEKWAALAKYTKSGLVNGHLFGFNFGAIDPLLLDAGLAAAAYFSASTDQERQAAMDNFTTQKFGTLVNFIASHSESWLGFRLDSSIAEGLVTSLFTGNWGADVFSLDGIMLNQGATTNFVGAERFTLGGAVANWGMGRIFGWADKALGLEAGQALQLFLYVKQGYQAYKAWQAAKAVSDLTTKLANAAEAFANAMKGTLFQPAADALSNAAKARATADAATATAKLQAYGQIAGAGVQFLIGILVDKFLGKVLGGLEDSLGLVPGTLAPLVAAGVYTLALPTMNAAIGSAFPGLGANFLPSLGPAGWIAVLAIFVLGNLFGVYRVELWCTADGYYPSYGTQPDYKKNDISGMGVWGGKVTNNLNNVIKTKSIESAQYKAQRLIGDMLEIQYNSEFNDSNGLPTIPIQIMTGRAEDVDYWKHVVKANVCEQRLGQGAKIVYDGQAALCDAGLRRMGVWQNLQTTAWTHIGF